MRLIIEFDNRINNLLNPSRFGQELREILANPADCLKYKNKIKQRVLMPLDSDAIINVLEKDPNVNIFISIKFFSSLKIN